MKTISERVQYILDTREWSQRELGRHAGLDESHIGAIVRGEVKSPQTKTMTAIASGSGFSLQWLATGEGPEQPYEAPALPLDDPYPSRAQAAVAARLLHVAEPAILTVLELNEEYAADPGEEYWFERMRAEDRKR